MRRNKYHITSILRIKEIIIVIVFTTLSNYAFCQINKTQIGKYYTEPIFTQVMSGMQFINPAYVGMWDRIGVQFFTRQDYAGQTGAPMTMYFGGYKPIKNSKNGAGINISYEKIGYENKFTFVADYAHEVKLNWKTYLRLGMKVGFINYSNYLSRYLTDLGAQIPDEALLYDIDQSYMLKWGVGILCTQKNITLEYQFRKW